MSHIGDRVSSFFKNVNTKIEELQVQAALGKAELSDKWEDVKKEARHEMADMKAEVKSKFETNKAKYEKLKAKIEHLEVQLALGKAETKEKLAEQKKNMADAIRDLKHMMESE